MIKLFYHPEGKLRLTTEDRSYLTVKPVWASPLTHPGKFLSLMNGKDKEITMFIDPEKDLDAGALTILRDELRRRYLNGVIKKVITVTTEFGATYWSVDTDRGQKEFVTQSLQENAQWLGPDHLLLIDVDGNRFEIPEIGALDEISRKLVYGTV